MNTLRRVWAWDGVDYLIQLGLICVFAYGFVYASGANQTLTEQGCSAYWEKYNPDVNLSKAVLVDSKQASYMKNGKWREYNINYSKNVSNYKTDLQKIE